MRLSDDAAEGILLAGGAAAILLQLADPRIAAALAQHSDFARRPTHRLRATLGYLAALAEEDDTLASRVVPTVASAHRDVPGARDPHLQLWVAATLYWSAARVRDLVLHPADDELYREYARIGTALGMPAALWPADREAFQRYVERYPLEVTDAARRVARDVLHPHAGPWWLRASMPAVRTITAGLLPAAVRDAYGLPHDPVRFERSVRRARRWYPRLPRRIRAVPRRWALGVTTSR